MGKKALCLIFAFLFSIESFAAVVSDNDGSAFVTKAEFENLKKDFAKQIKNYNDSIDSKIDGAIASYLAGLQLAKVVNLNNVYEALGGSKIKFGNVNLVPNIAPVTGYSYYMLNAGNGYGVGYITSNNGKDGAGWWSTVRNELDSNWGTGTHRFMGKWGKYLVYQAYNGQKYLMNYQVGMVQAIHFSGWYSANNHGTMTIYYPLGEKPARIGEPLLVGSEKHIDSYASFYRHAKKEQIDLSWLAYAYDCPTNSDLCLISDENIKIVDSDKTNLGNQSEKTCSSGWGPGENINGILVYNWNIENNKTWDNLSPGFMTKTKWNTKLYGGVPLFTAEKNGIVEISGMKMKYFNDTAGYVNADVYFAINDTEFANDSELKGNVKLDCALDEIVIDNNYYRYKIATDELAKLKLNVTKDKTYYIKCQYDLIKTSNVNKYVQIEDGMIFVLTPDE